MIDPTTKLWSQPKAIAAFLADDIEAPPVQVEIAPTNRCNARCPWCFYASHANKPSHSRDELPWSLMQNCLNDLSEMGTQAVSWTGGGEPSVHRHFAEAVDHAAKLGFRQGLFTNGYRLVENAEHLAWIRISMTDRLTVPESAAEYARRTRTGVVVNVTPANLGQLDRLAFEARDAGVQFFQVRPALAERWTDQPRIDCPDFLLKYETDTFSVVLSRYKWEDAARPHGYPFCHGHRLVPFVWPNGSVSVCGYHFKKPDFTFGNLHETSFREIWHGETRRRLLASGVRVIDACQHCCKLHEANKALARLRGEIQTEQAEFV